MGFQEQERQEEGSLDERTVRLAESSTRMSVEGSDCVPKAVVCIICKTSDVHLAFARYTGYVEGSFFDVFVCERCGTHFISPENMNEALYDMIYSSPENS